MAKKRYSKNKGTQGAASPNSQTPANLPRTKTSNPQAGMKQLISPLKPTTQVASGIWNPTGKPFPDVPEISETTPPLETIGATGVAIFSGIITSEEYNPDFNWRDATKIYEQMLRNDSQIAAIREMVELPIRRTKWSIVPASDDPRDKEIASFVESCLFHDNCYVTTEGRRLTQKWDDLLRHMLMHIWYGYMAFEQNFRVEDGWVKWAHFTPLLPRTVWRWWVGEDNELTGIQQWTFKDYNYQFVNIPADKLLLFSHRQEGNNYEGVAALRQIYKNWFYKVQYEKIDAIGIERNAIVPPVITLPENFTPNDAAMALQIVQNLRANELMGVTLPPGWILEYPKNMQKYAADAMTAIKYHDTLMARRLLCQFLNLGSDETGTYALADTQVQTFLSSLQGEAEYIEDVFNSDAIPRLVDYNFDGVEVYPTLKCSRIQGDITVIGTALKDVLGQNPLLQPYPELQSWYADLLGIPTPPADLIQATNPTSPTNSAQPDVKQATPNAEPQNVEGIKSKDQAGAAMTEALDQVRLLNESIRAIDAVGRGKEHLMLYNPNHLPAGPGGGQFAPKGGGGMGGSGGYSGGHGASSHRAEAGHMGLRREAQPGEQLHPVRVHSQSDHNPYRTPNLKALHGDFGDHQIGAAIHDYPKETLRAIARENNISLKGARTHDEMVTRITEHVTGGKYHADFAKSEHAGDAKEEALRARMEAARASHAKAVAREAAAKTPEAKDAAFQARVKAQEKMFRAEAAHAAHVAKSSSGAHGETAPGGKRATTAKAKTDDAAKATTAARAKAKPSANEREARAEVNRGDLVSQARAAGSRAANATRSNEEMVSRAEHERVKAELERVKAENARLKTKGEGKAKSSTRERITDQKAATGRHGGKISTVNFKVPHFDIDPFAPNSLRGIHLMAGTDHLREALHLQLVASLKGMAHTWMRLHPEYGKPASFSRRADLENYLYHTAIRHDGQIHSQEDVDAANAREQVTNGDTGWSRPI